MEREREYSRDWILDRVSCIVTIGKNIIADVDKERGNYKPFGASIKNSVDALFEEAKEFASAYTDLVELDKEQEDDRESWCRIDMIMRGSGS